MDKDYALIIGINDYRDLKPLAGPIRDAKNFRKWVESPKGGNIPKRNCHLILSTLDPLKPLQDDIDEKLCEIYQDGRDTGFRRVYFFFAGHGFGVSWNENALCLPKWSRLFRNYALSSSGYLDIMVKSGVFEEVFFFLDCCRNRSVGSVPANPYINWVRPGSGTPQCSSFVAYASEFDNAAHEAALMNGNNIQTQGYFTKALIQGLEGDAVDTNGDITTHSLKDYLALKVKEIAQNKQSVRFEDGFTTDGIINSPGQRLIEFQVEFSEPGDIEFKGPDLEVIQQDHSSEWPNVLTLSKGIYHLKNNTTGKEAYVSLEMNFNPDGSVKAITYEF